MDPDRFLARVTVTGADDRTDPSDLVALSERFPFVEWGVLLSNRALTGPAPRYPGTAWLSSLAALGGRLQLSAHLCGRWVRDVTAGRWTVHAARPDLLTIFDRVQLNFRPYLRDVAAEPFLAGLREQAAGPLKGVQFIFQVGDLQCDLLREAQSEGLDAVGMFDLSGGTGMLPQAWPAPAGYYAGYAGGLSPDNLTGQLERIAAAVGTGPDAPLAWVDAETGVRTPDGETLDLSRVERFLELASPWVRQ